MTNENAAVYFLDRNVDEALQQMQRANRIDELANTVERGTYSLQARQRKFLLTRDTAIADGFSADLADISAALDELLAYPDAQPLAQHVTTIRDGLVQYDEQFQAFLNAEREIGLNTESGLSAQLRRTSAALRAACRDSGNTNPMCGTATSIARRLYAEIRESTPTMACVRAS